MSPDDIARNLILKDQLITKDDIYKALANILWRGIKWHEQLWSEDLKIRAANELYIKKHPHEFKARERSFIFMSRFALPAPEGEPVPDPRTINAEKLGEMGLSEDQIRKLAGVDEEELK